MDSQVWPAMLGSLARWLATGAGAWLLSHGYTTTDQSPAILGAVLLLGSLGWSFWQKYKSGQHLEQARVTPPSSPVPTPNVPV